MSDGVCYACPHCGHCVCDSWAPFKGHRCPECDAPAQDARFAEMPPVIIAGWRVTSYRLKCFCFGDDTHQWEIDFDDETVQCVRCYAQFRVTSGQLPHKLVR